MQSTQYNTEKTATYGYFLLFSWRILQEKVTLKKIEVGTGITILNLKTESSYVHVTQQ